MAPPSPTGAWQFYHTMFMAHAEFIIQIEALQFSTFQRAIGTTRRSEYALYIALDVYILLDTYTTGLYLRPQCNGELLLTLSLKVPISIIRW